MNIETLKQFKQSSRYTTVMQRSRSANAMVLPAVQDIMDAVKLEGDAAVLRYTAQYDKAKLTSLKVAAKEIKAAYKKVDQTVIEALTKAAENITTVHAAQVPTSSEDSATPVNGVKVRRRWQPIERVGLYVPGGKAVYPSSVLMTAIPAKIAGCEQIIITTPPQPDGSIAPSILVAADIAGVTEIYKVGGAQAIAALTYGTEIIPKAYKIFGPGNAYVAAAKLLAFSTGEVAIDAPAGPSEVLILADDTANPRWVAADIVCDTEHGDDSAGVLVTTSQTLAEQVALEIEDILTTLPTADRVNVSLESYGAMIVTETLEEAIDFANDYASEHTLVMTEQPELVAEKIINAGSVFVGPYACKASGDYATGSNHVLPTAGAAKMFSGLSTLDFLRLVEYQSVSKEGLQQLRSIIEPLAIEEQLPGHAYSSAVRFE